MSSKDDDIHPSHTMKTDEDGENARCIKCGKEVVVLGFFSGLSFPCPNP